MKFGNLCARGGGGFYWLPENKIFRFSVSNKKINENNGVILIDCNQLGAMRYPTNLCVNCNKIIAELNCLE